VHSPLRTESDVFRAAVLVGIGAVVAVAIGAITDAAIGGVVAAALVGLAIGLLLRAGRGSLPEEVALDRPKDGTYRILVIANQTVGGSELLEEIHNRARGREAVELLVVAPALTRSRLEQIASDTDRARAEAEARLERSLQALRAAGVNARGSIGDENPVVAAIDALRTFGADEVIVSTHPPEQSRWLERGVVEDLRRQVELPVAHVVVVGAEVA
jgi:GABA permease